MTDNAPNTPPADPPPASPDPTPPASPDPAPTPPPVPDPVDDDTSMSDLRGAVSSLADVVTDLMGEVRTAAGEADNAPEKLPWHKKKWF